MFLLRHMEDSIKDLCDRLLAEQDEARARDLGHKLRAALHEYVEQTRSKILAFNPVNPSPLVRMTFTERAKNVKHWCQNNESEIKRES